ncbi:MAG: SUMF1/EgtB/PvdO family nonheme iron enzyme [Acidobacteriota bacterium]
MHAEAITYTRQTLGYRAPRFTGTTSMASTEGSKTRLEGDAHIPGGRFLLGRTSGSGFSFDNEQRAHEVEVKPFSISRTSVTQGEFAAFVEDGGYQRSELWNETGWQWRQKAGAEHPVYWQPTSTGRWLRRHFDQWVTLEDRVPVIHINWYEADAYCRWAGRRLPTEAEWEMAASCEPSSDGFGINARKRLYPWGDQRPTPDRANLDWGEMGGIDVDELPLSDSAFGCRQMIGNCWEWTSTDFGPYPDFAPGPYKEYSEPWFGDHKVLRGGCWVTRSSMIHNAYRNFYTPDRRDVWAGFRTCAVK